MDSSFVISKSFAQNNGTSIYYNDKNDNSDNNEHNVEYRAVLSGDNEVPPIDNQATGIADFNQVPMVIVLIMP